jgi:hypothetical protein
VSWRATTKVTVPLSNAIGVLAGQYARNVAKPSAGAQVATLNRKSQ